MIGILVRNTATTDKITYAAYVSRVAIPVRIKFSMGDLTICIFD
jgi:hypothetical protein